MGEEDAVTPTRLARYDAFVKSIPPQLDEKGEHVLRATLRIWRRYYVFLLIILGRYVAVVPRFKETSKALMEAIPEEKGHCATEFLEVVRDVHLEIESFYLFSKILVDRMADSFGYYFGVKWREYGSTHTQLQNKFTDLVVGRSMKREPGNMLDLINEIGTRIVKYRTEFIEHINEPRISHQTSVTKDGLPTIYPLVTLSRREMDLLEPQVPAEDLWSLRLERQVPTEDLRSILGLIDRYIDALLAFFESNFDKCALPRRDV